MSSACSDSLPLISSSCPSICAFFKTYSQLFFSLNGEFSLSPHLLSSQDMIPFFTFCTCSPVKMWQIPEFKCSKMWSKTAALNHLHKEEFWTFSFSYHLPGIPYSLSPDWVTGSVRGLWCMDIIFRVSGGYSYLAAAACFLIWYNFQTF